ncbi:hypothetical protein Tco_0005062 [Tanacetum coccineum]
MKPLDALLMKDEVINTTPARENEKFIKSSVDDLVLILRESEVTSVCNDLECSMPFDSLHLPCTDALGDLKVDIDLPFGEKLDTLSMGDRKIDLNSLRDVGDLGSFLADDPVSIPRMFDEPLEGDILYLEQLLIEDTFFKLSLALFPNEPSIPVSPLPDFKQIRLRGVKRFDPFFSLTQSSDMTWVMKRPFDIFSICHYPVMWHTHLG